MKVVGVGASAGGLEAMSDLLARLPKDTGASFVFLQHLSPNSKSMIGELLAKQTEMRISVVYEDQPIQPNHVYVMSENRNLVFSHGMLITKERNPNAPINLPIDQFFHSLGESLGKESIGILLSGTGTDGSRGLRTIKERGGIVLVQSPETAKFDGMPRAAIELNIADDVAPIVKLGPTLVDLLRAMNNRPNEPQLDQKAPPPYFDRILEHLTQQNGIDYSGYRTPTLLRRLENRMLLRKSPDLASYWHQIQQDPNESSALAKDFLIGVTRFFRDPEAFEKIRKEILPKVFKKPKPEGEPYRFWVPGCSTGEEAYTIAMLVQQYIEQQELGVDYKIFASDVDESAIKFAIKGVYTPSVVADTPKDLMAKYFVKEGDEMQIRPNLRKKVLFAVQNLLGDPPFINMDLISCRNLLIYLKPETQQQVLSSLHFALESNGFLFLGPSESLGDLRYAFSQSTRQWNIFQKQSDARLRFHSNYTIKEENPNVPPANQADEMQQEEMTNYDDSGSDPFTLYLVERFAPISLFVNEQLDVLYINGEAERLLNMPRALARLNLNKMLGQEELLALKSGVEKVIEEGEEVSYRDVALSKGEQDYKASLRFNLPELPKTQKDQRIILIEIYLAEEDSPASKEQQEDADADFTNDKVKALQRELQSAKQRSQRLVNELEATNEELQTSNRELMASNEELQSTNEELQSVNEELYTVNSELQLKNEELSTAHNDINNLLKSTEIGTIFLDKELNIRKFTPAVKRQFNLLESDVGRPITSFSNTFRELDLEQVCYQVFDTLSAYEKEIIDTSGEHFLMRILPYRTEEDNIDGLVLTFININDLVSTQQRMDRRLADKFKAIFNYSQTVIGVIDADGVLKSMNRSLGPFAPQSLVGKKLFEEIPEHLSNELRSAFQSANNQKQPERLDLQLNEDTWFEFTFIPSYNQNEAADSEVELIMTARESSQDRMLLHQMENSLKEYRSLMDNAAQQIALVAKDGTINYINYARHTGKQKEELIGQSIYDYIPDDSLRDFKEIIKNIFQGKPFGQLKFSFDYEGGRKGEIELFATPVIIDGKIKYVAVVQQSDLTAS
jgi:two-component system, chemotaxis family, CheB/CheR fusion protein